MSDETDDDETGIDPRELIAAHLAEKGWDDVDSLAGELTELQMNRAEAYWQARANDIFVRNRPEIIQQLAQLDATNLQTVVLARGLAELKAALEKG